MSTIAAPGIMSDKRRKSARWYIIPIAIVVIGVGAWGGLRLIRGSSPQVVGGTYYTIQPMSLDVKVSVRGDLQAVNNIDIACRVEGTNTIQQIVKEGSFVKKGDTLAVLDSSAIAQKVEDITLDVQSAQAALTTAREMKDIQEGQNAANIEAATVTLQLAKLDLQQYVDGTYPQDLENAKTTLQMADITLKNKEEDLSQTQSLFRKGFVMAAKVKESELAVTTAQNDLEKAKTALNVLIKYANPMNLASKKSAVTQAEQALSRTKKENLSNLAQKVADFNAKQQALALQKRRLEHYQEQLSFCTIKAPADGIVVYGTSGQRNVQNPIQEGASVRERQLLVRLPDTSSMKAVVSVNESQVPKLKVGQRATVKVVGVAHPIAATLTYISPLVDNSQRWLNPDLREYPVDLTLDETPPGLKPGISADPAEILINHYDHVLAVPLTAIYTTGRDTYVFVRQAEGPAKPTQVKLGVSTETYVQVTGGISAGEQVQLLEAGQGRLLSERAGIKTEEINSSRDQSKSRKREHQEAPTTAPAAPATPEAPAAPATPAPSAKAASPAA
jgi:RND family efflux transporter MFP subunit